MTIVHGRVALENLLRHEDGTRVTADQVRLVLDWDRINPM